MVTLCGVFHNCSTNLRRHRNNTNHEMLGWAGADCTRESRRKENVRPLPGTCDRLSIIEYVAVMLYVCDAVLTGRRSIVGLVSLASTRVRMTQYRISAMKQIAACARIARQNAGTNPVAIGGATLAYATASVLIQLGQTWNENEAPGAVWYCVCDTALASTLNIQDII